MAVEKRKGSDRRQAPRVLVNIEVDYGNKDNFLFAYITDLSATGIFVRTDTPEPPGTRLNLRFTPTRGGRVLDLEGEVIWINPLRTGAADNINPGMGIRFVDLSDDDRVALQKLVTTFAYL
jgi:type IV pilus assembly protein PilZ